MFILMAGSSLVDATPNCFWKNKRKKSFLVPQILWPVFTLLAFSHTSNLITPFGSCAPNEIRGWWVTVLWPQKLPFISLNVTKQIDGSLLLRNHCRGYYLSAGNNFFNLNWCNEELLSFWNQHVERHTLWLRNSCWSVWENQSIGRIKQRKSLR